MNFIQLLLPPMSYRNNSKIVPYLYKPPIINNITHAITLLKIKQDKYKKYSISYIPQKINLYTFNTEKFCYEDIIQGVLDNKLIDKYNIMKKTILSEFDRQLESRIASKIKEIELMTFNINLGLKTEEYLFASPSETTFEDEFLYDIYILLKKQHSPLIFLSFVYEKFITKFMKLTELTSNKVTIQNEKELVINFVKLKFNKTEFNISIYEGRYLFAEVYVLLRLGRKSDILALLDEFSYFFNHVHDNFGVNFGKFLNGKAFEIGSLISFTDDKFKVFLNNIMYGKIISDGYVISSVEDYIFTLLFCNRSLNYKDYINPKVQLLVCLFTKNYAEATRLCLKHNFSVVSKFFILFQLSNIENLISLDSKDLLFNKDDISAVFMNFFFAVIQKLKLLDSKIKLIEILQNNPKYEPFIPEYLTKYDLFDIIRSPCLNKSIFSQVVHLLKRKDDRKLLKIIDLIDVNTYGIVMENVFEQAILMDEEVKININTIDNSLYKNLKILIDFYEFNLNPTPETLTKLCIFDKHQNLSKYKFIIEHIFKKIVNIIKKIQNHEMANVLFKLCGMLDLNSECSDLISSELVDLI